MSKIRKYRFMVDVYGTDDSDEFWEEVFGKHTGVDMAAENLEQAIESLFCDFRVKFVEYDGNIRGPEREILID